MKILLDTEAWLWSLGSPERLGKKARNLLEDPAHDLYLSAASTWEISIKAAIGKLGLPEPPASFVASRMERQGILPLPVNHAHAAQVFALPMLHKDPFDRMLLAQAMLEGLAIMSSDQVFRRYDVKFISAV